MPRTVSLTEPFRCSSWPERKLKEMKIPREKKEEESTVGSRLPMKGAAGSHRQSLIVSGKSSMLARATFVSACARGTSMSVTVLVVHSSHLGKSG